MVVRVATPARPPARLSSHARAVSQSTLQARGSPYMVYTARPSHWRRGAACSHTLPTPFLAGNIYVSDSARHRVAVFSPIGAFVRAFGSGPGGGFGELDDPRGMAVRDGRAAGGRCCHVYVADMCNHRVQARVTRALAESVPRPVYPPPPHRYSPLTARRASSSAGTATARANSNIRAASLSRAGCCSCLSTWAGE